MKTYIYSTIAVLAVFLMSCSKNDDRGLTTIGGNLTFPIQQMIHLQQVENGQTENIASAKPNAKGQFDFAVRIEKPGFYIIDYGQMARSPQLIRLYLEPHMNVSLEIRPQDYSIIEKSGKNDLVKKANDLHNTYTKYVRINSKSNYRQFFRFLTDTAMVNYQQLQSTIVSNDKDFENLMKLSVQCDLETSAYMYLRFPAPTHPKKENLPALYTSWKSENKFSNPQILKLFNGISWMDSYFMHNYLLFADSPTKQIDFLINTTKSIADSSLQEAYLLYEIGISRLNSDQYQELKDSVGQYITSETGKAYIAEYEKKLNVNVGSQGVNFSYPDVNGKNISFSQFRGKIVYVDLWATWCAPCKAQIPHLMKLEEEYKDKDIVFVGISLDKAKDKAKWIQFVKEKKLKGYQLLANKEFKSDLPQAYNVKTIPRFLLFDKKGRVVNADALRPSDPNLKPVLDALLSK